MKTLADKPQSIAQNIWDVFRFYPAIWKMTWPLILLTSFLHVFYPSTLKLNTYVGLTIIVACILIIWFLFAAIIYRSFNYLKGDYISYRTMWRHARRRYIAVLAGNLLFLAIFMLVVFLEAALIKAGELIHIEMELLIFSIVLDIFIFILVYFSVPIIVLDNSPVFTAFERSARLVLGNWWRTFIPWLFFFIILAVISGIQILVFGHSRFAMFSVGMFLVNVIFYGFIVGYTLVMLNDLKLRKQH